MPVAFVSYAREDLDFVRTLRDKLSQSGWKVAWDQDRGTVRPSAPWPDEVKAAIRSSDKFIFVISPDSVASRQCRGELAYARNTVRKQVISILRRAVPEQDMPADLAEITWIGLDHDPFDAMLPELIRALDTDLEVSAEHAWLLVRTAKWNQSKRRSQLLRGKDLKAAEAFLDRVKGHAWISPTQPQRDYVAASRRGRKVRRSTMAGGLAVLTGLGAFGLVQANTAGQRNHQATANSIAYEADQVAPTDPSLAAQFDVAANEAYPTPDSETQLLDTSTEPLSSKLTGPARPVSSVALSKNGKVLAAGAGDGKVWLWDMADPAHPVPLGSPLAGPDHAIDSVAFSPDGTMLAASSGNAIWRWRFADPAHPARPTVLAPALTGPARPFGTVVFSRDGRTLFSADVDNTIWRWDVTDPARPVPLGVPLTGPTGTIFSLAIGPVGDVLAAASGDGTIWRWNIADPVHPARLGLPLRDPAGGVYSVAFSPDGRYLAAGSYDSKVWRWSLADPARPVSLGPLSGPTSIGGSVAFSPDGTILAATSSDDKVWRWNLADPSVPVPLGSPLTAPEVSVDVAVFGPADDILVTGCNDGIVRLWSLPASVLTGPAGSVGSMGFGPRGNVLAGSDSYGKAWLWNLADPGRPGQALTGPKSRISSAALSPDGRLVAAPGSLAKSGEGLVWLWEVADLARPVRLSP
ncbi:MAG: toll/interleukin-1 receptor domain-containing protein, partial [Streptosporangiaceae bacterium]